MLLLLLLLLDPAAVTAAVAVVAAAAATTAPVSSSVRESQCTVKFSRLLLDILLRFVRLEPRLSGLDWSAVSPFVRLEIFPKNPSFTVLYQCG